MEFIPSTKYGYSNSNYFLLGYILEQVSERSYDEYLADNIFKPAGLVNTYYDSPSQVIKGRVKGYTGGQSDYRNVGYISMSQVFGAGALLSNAEDLFKWHQALYTYKLVGKEILEKAFSRFTLADSSLSGYGYGWFIKDWKGSKLIGHGGAIDGFRAMEIYLPDQDIFLVTLFNADNDNFFGLFEAIAEAIVGDSFKDDYKDLKIPAEVLDSYTGTYQALGYPDDLLIIYREGEHLYMDLSNRTGMHMQLFAQSETLFYIPAIKRVPTTVEFVLEQGKVKSLFWTQEKKTEAMKIKTAHD